MLLVLSAIYRHIPGRLRYISHSEVVVWLVPPHTGPVHLLLFMGFGLKMGNHRHRWSTMYGKLYAHWRVTNINSEVANTFLWLQQPSTHMILPLGYYSSLPLYPVHLYIALLLQRH